jgi:hypothetical protein
MGFVFSERKLSGILNWPTIPESPVIKKIRSFRILPRNSIDKLSHAAFSLSFKETKAWKNLSGSTLNFAERKARYSPNGNLLCLNLLHSDFARKQGI